VKVDRATDIQGLAEQTTTTCHSPARATLMVLTATLRSTHNTVNVESNKPTQSVDSTTPRHVVVTAESHLQHTPRLLTCSIPLKNCIGIYQEGYGANSHCTIYCIEIQLKMNKWQFVARKSSGGALDLQLTVMTSNPCDMAIFQDGGCRHLGFLKLQIFNGRSNQEGQNASSCQISSNRGRHMAIVQDSGRRQLGFSKFEIINGRNGQWGSNCITMLNFVQIAETAAELWCLVFQENGRRPLGFSKFRIFMVGQVMVSKCITVLNSVEIARTAAKLCQFQYYASLA